MDLKPSVAAGDSEPGTPPLPEAMLRFVAEAGRELDAASDREAVLSAAVRAPVPAIADMAVIFLVDPAGGAPDIRLAHRHPGREASLLARLGEHAEDLMVVASHLRRSPRAERPQWLPHLDDRMVRRLAGNTPGLLALRDQLGIGSLLVFPMMRADRAVGAFALGRDDGGPAFGPAELAAGSVLAQRMALAIENALLREVAGEETHREARRDVALRKWAHVFEYANWGSAIIEADGRIEVANPALARMQGLTSPDALNGKRFEQLAAAAERAEIADMLRAEGGAHSYQATHVREDGTEFPVLVSLTSVPTEEGRAAYRVAHIQDISDVRRTEERLHRAQRMEAVGRLAGGVAHEVNNMMTIILGFADFLQQSVGEAERADVEEVRKAAIRAAGITQQLLAYGRQQLLQPTILELDGVVAEMAELLRPLLPANVVIDTRIGGRGWVRADRAQLEQVIINLAFNARDAMPRGGRLTLSAEFRQLDEDFATRQIGVPMPAGRYALLAVADSGTGMSAETQSKVFEPFFTTKPIGQGTGLGLATVYGIVKQSGGFVWVDSTPGEGTVFTVCLPQVDIGVAARPIGSPLGGLQRGRGTIMVVEDDDSVRTLAHRTLREAGYAVVDARNGLAALDLIDAGTEIDAVVTDIVMPEMGGADLRHALHRRRPGLPVLSVSAYPNDDVVLRGLLRPEDPFLQKPFTPNALTRAIGDLLAIPPPAG